MLQYREGSEKGSPEKADGVVEEDIGELIVLAPSILACFRRSKIYLR